MPKPIARFSVPILQTIAFAALLCPLGAFPSSVQAQVPTNDVLTRSNSVIRLTLDEQHELESLSELSSVVFWLYTSSVIGLGGGFVTAVIAPFAAISNGNSAIGILGLAATLGGLGLVSLGLAIGFDVDVGSKRGGLQQRIRTRVGATGLTFEGTFE